MLGAAEMRCVARAGDCQVRRLRLYGEEDRLRRRCKAVVDEDRLALARERGYRVARFTMAPFECSPKNDVLVGWSQEWGEA